jgi:flavodoxin I
LIDVSTLKPIDLEQYDNLILGTSTWGMGDLQDDWDAFIPRLEAAKLDGKTIALFGLGDCESYSDTFVDGMGIIFETIRQKNCKFTGTTSIEGYSFSESRAVNNVFFVGLPLDEDNESDLSEERLTKWVDQNNNRFSIKL